MTSSRSMPLLYTLHCGNLYGTERMALATLEGLTDYRRIVFAPPGSEGPSLLGAARGLGYEVRPIPRLPDLVRALLPIFARHRRIDMISTSATHNMICAWLARLFFVRLRQLNVVHGGGEDRYSYANKHRLNETGIKLVAVSGFVREKLLAHGVTNRKVVVIENFLTPSDIASRPKRSAFDPASSASRPLDLARIGVTVVSRLDPVKRLDVLFAAISGGRLDNFHFDVFGTGELFEAFRQQPGVLRGQVTLHGYVPDIPVRLAQSDLFLHLCPEEPFGLVILEAFAAGVPVIVPAAGGAGELVERGVNGMTFTPADSEALATCLQYMSRMEGAGLDALADAGRSALQSRYSAQVGVAGYRRALASA